VLLSLFLAPSTIKKRKHSNQPKLITHPIQSHLSTQREKQENKPPRQERKLLCACFVSVLVTWMSFASGGRELRGGVLSMLETHIVMSSLIFCLILILMFRLAFTLVLLLAHSHVLCLALLLVLHLSSLMDLTITHMILVHKRTALNIDALVTVHVLIVVIVSRIRSGFPAGGSFPHFESRHLGSPHFPYRGSRPTRPSGEVQRTVKTSSGRMVKCWIPKIYLTNPSTEPSTFSRPM
jgi:hypothetical protein